jgi:hypothetical protein
MEKLDSDLTWAKPYLDQVRASVARGEVISGEEFLRFLDGRLRAIRATAETSK